MNGQRDVGRWLLVTASILSGCALSTSMEGLTGGPASSDAGPSVDLTSDSANCGRCGHDCMGAACEAGLCRPTLLAAGLHAPHALEQDEGTLYVSAWGDSSLWSIAKTSGALTRLASYWPCERCQIHVALGASVLYWSLWREQEETSSSAFYLLDRPDAGASPIAFFAGEGAGAAGLAVSGGNILLADVLGRRVDAAPIAHPDKHLTWQRSGAPTAITADASHVYWIEAHGIYALDLSATPSRGPVLLAGGRVAPAAIASDGSSVYWTDTGSGRVESCPGTGCPASGPHIVASDQSNPAHLALDRTTTPAGVYWVNLGEGAGSGSIAACTTFPAGCGRSPTVIAVDQPSPAGIVVDRAFVYWATAVDPGSILRAAK